MPLSEPEGSNVTAPAAQPGPGALRQPRGSPPARSDALGSSLRLLTVGGIDVRVHASWLIIAGLVTWSLATSYFPTAVPGARGLEAWLLGAVAAILLFASVIAHELAHSLVARARGTKVRSITLFIFGGVSNLSGEAKRPSAEFVIAIVGPVTSFVIAVLALGLASLSPRGSPIEATASYLAIINAALGGFNLVPGFPLDGGRVLRSIVWSVTNDLRRATEIAAGVGKVVAWGLMLWGFWRVLDGDVFGGIWVAAIGWFLQNAASGTVQQTVLETRLRRLRVADVIRPDSSAVAPDASVADLIDRYMLPGARRAVPVVRDGRPIGIVTLSDIRPVPAAERATTTVEQVMGGRENLASVTPETRLQAAIERLGEGDYDQLPVIHDGQLVGMLTRADVVRELQLREELKLEAGS